MSADAAKAVPETAAKTVGRGVMFIGFAKVFFMISGSLQRILLTRIVGAADFGDFAVVNNVVSIVNNTVVQGTIQGVSKLTAEDDARAGAVQRAGIRLQAGLGLLLALALIVGAPFIAALYETPRLTLYFRIAALIPLIYAVYAVYIGSANGLRRFRTQASFDVGFSTAKTILLLGLAYLWSVTGAFVGFVAAAAVTGNYEALRTFALLPYQALLVVTFVIFPLVSQATFAADREATRAYVSQTMRYALILAGLMGIVLAARPSALFGTIYKPEYRAGAEALPILAAGQCCLALLSVACSILNAAGWAGTSVGLMGLTLAVGSTGIAIFVPRAAPGAPMLVAAATATAVGTATGLVAALLVLRTRLGGMPPIATMARVALAVVCAVVAARFVPGQGKLVGFAVMALVGLAYVAVLVVTREFGPEDRAKFAKVFKR